jgi:hypothetical protein
LLQGFQDAAEVDGDEQELQSVDAEEVARAVAAQEEVPEVQREVGNGGDGQPVRFDTPGQRNGEDQDQADVDSGDGEEVVQPEEGLGQRERAR